jgi:dCMP deaminase
MAKLQNTDTEFMRIAKESAQRSNCIRPERHVGAIAVRDGKVILTAYNGTSDGFTPCSARGECVRKTLGIPTGKAGDVSWCVHAEQRIICAAAREGIALKGAKVYTTLKPCLVCTKLLAECGIKQVFYANDYPDKMAADYAAEIGLKITQID